MKKLLNIILIIAGMLSAIGCQEKEVTVELPEGIEGQWQLARIDGEETDNVIVYVEILPDASFNLYQKVWTSNYQKFTGKVEFIDDNGVKFIHSNGEVSTYPSMTITKDSMTLTREFGEVNTYYRTRIPDTIKEIAVPVTKSVEVVPFL